LPVFNFNPNFITSAAKAGNRQFARRDQTISQAN